MNEGARIWAHTDNIHITHIYTYTPQEFHSFQKATTLCGNVVSSLPYLTDKMGYAQYITETRFGRNGLGLC